MHRIKSPELNHDFDEIVNGLANDAYVDFTRDNPELSDTPWAAPYCFDLTLRLHQKLSDHEIEARPVEGGGGLDDVHFYLETPDGLIIDPTWQQFVDSSLLNNTTPRTLIIEKSNLEDMLTAYGIPNVVQTLWGIPENEDWNFW